MKLASNKASYIRALDKLVNVCLEEAIQDVKTKIPELIAQDFTSGEKLKTDFGRDVDFEINWMRGKIKELGIDLGDFQRDYLLTLAKIFPEEISFMPITWSQNQELTYRYSALKMIIQSNTEWWNKWKNMINLDNDGIYFYGKKYTLNDMGDSDFTSLEEKFMSLANIPTLGDFEKIGKCISEVGPTDKQELMNFFGLKSGNYWTSSKGGYLHNGMAYFFNFEENKYSYTPVREVFHIRPFHPVK